MRTQLQNGKRGLLQSSVGLPTKKFGVYLVISLFSFIFYPNFSSAQNSPIAIKFTLSKASTTSAGLFRKDSTLVRTLWNNVFYQAGTHTAKWDRKDDDGFLVNDTLLILKVISSNVKYEWEGAFIGNTSDSMTGKSKHRYFDRPCGMAISGNTAYFSTGYAEGISAVYKFNFNSYQNRTSILSNMGDIDLSTQFTATDGTNVYWAGYDAYDHDVNLVYATSVSNDREVSFRNGTSVSMMYGRTYNSALDAYTNNRAAIPSGLAVQRSGNFLFVSHKGINELHVLNKTTGALVQTISVTSPRQLCVDMNDNLWMISGNTTVQKFSVNTNGTLTSATLSISGLQEPLALAVSPNNYVVVIIDGGNSQQLKAFNNSNGRSVWTLGQSGGYSTDPAVYNDKFFFKDSARQIQTESFIAFQSDSSFWFGDPGNDRIQHFSASRNYLNTIMSLPCTYSIRADPNDPTRVFNDFLEFEIDYSKKLAPNNGSWKLVRNWRKGVPLNFFGSYNVLRSVITLSNGRTYATLEDPNNLIREFVELPASGNVRFTGVTIDSYEDFLVDNDGTLRIIYTGSVTDTMSWTSRSLRGFDNRNNPIWNNPTTIASSPRTTIKDPKPNTQSFPAKTKSDKLIVFCNRKNDAFGLRDGYHLGAIKKGTNKWLWKASKSTTENYFGPMPKDGSFDIGNGVEYPGGHVYAVDNNIFWNYHGEFWKNSQSNIWNHYADNGLMVSQFGIVSLDGERTYGEQAFPMGAGNVFSSSFVKVDSNYYLYHNDESVHGGVHRWKISNLSSIKEQSSVIRISTNSGGLVGAYFDGADLNNLNFKIAVINTSVNLTTPPNQISNSNNFSARWTGFVKPGFTQNYTFYTNTSKGVRLWVDGKLIIDRWNNTTTTQYTSVAVALNASKPVSIKMEINGGTASLSWSSPSQAKQIIPSSGLVPSRLPDYTTEIDLMEGVNPQVVLQNNLYGWSRNSTGNYNSNGLFWRANTGHRTFTTDHTDVYANFREDANYEITRDISQSNKCLSAWTITGKINLDENFPEIPGDPGGVHIEVLDENGKVIFRLTHEMEWTQSGINPTWIKANGTTVVQRTQHQMEAIMNQNNPFTLEAGSGGLVFTYGNFPSVTIPVFDTTCNWRKPGTFRIDFLSRGGQNFYDQNVSVSELVLTPIETKTTITSNGPTSFCQGSSVILTAGSGSSYLWNNNSTNRSITVSTSGKYVVSVTDANGCVLRSDTNTVRVNPLPVANITASGPLSFCQGSSVTLTAPVSRTYLWNNNATTRSIIVSSSGSFSVRVTDSNTCSNTSQASTTTSNARPTPTVTLLGLTVGSNYTTGNQWYLDGVLMQGMVNQTCSIIRSGNYSVIVTNQFGCTGTDMLNVPLPISDYIFSASCVSEQELQFDWKITGDDASVEYFIEYSNDGGVNWNPLTSINNDPNMQAIVKEYSVKTQRIQIPNCFYRWRAYDASLNTEKNMVISAPECGFTDEPKIYPNPFINKFSISIPSLVQSDDTYNLVIINNLNQIVYSLTLPSTSPENGLLYFEIDQLDLLSSGIYMVKIEKNNTIIAHSKLIKTE